MIRSAGQPLSRIAILSFFYVTLASAAFASEPVRVQFFYSPGCRMCVQAQDAVKAAEIQHGDLIAVERIDTTLPGAVERLFERLDAAKVTETDSLVVFVNDICLSGGDAIVNRLDAAIADAIRARASPDIKMDSRFRGNDKNVIRKLKDAGNPEKKELKPSQPSDRLGFWTVSAAGLADGINPCAFATIVLFASMMTVAGRSKRAILVIGGVFALTVYATYFCIGYFFFSVFEWMRSTPSLSIVSNIVYLAAVASCVLFAILSGIDSFRAWKTGATDKMLLSLPAALKNRIARTMSRTARSASLIVSAITAGVIVSILESACTGQIYFPLLAGLARTPGRRADALLTLLWYNLLFVLPLVVIVVASAYGLSNQRIAEFGRKRLPLTKALLAAVFLAMAVWMADGIR
ncbi:MAG: hypothetical protein ABIH86_02785 [Planctomycetota bacterium]